MGASAPLAEALSRIGHLSEFLHIYEILIRSFQTRICADEHDHGACGTKPLLRRRFLSNVRSCRHLSDAGNQWHHAPVECQLPGDRVGFGRGKIGVLGRRAESTRTEFPRLVIATMQTRCCGRPASPPLHIALVHEEHPAAPRRVPSRQ